MSLLLRTKAGLNDAIHNMTPIQAISYFPPAKKTRCNNSSRYQQLQDQINALASLIVQGSSSSLVLNETPDNFLPRPAGGKKILDFGELKTDIDENKHIDPKPPQGQDLARFLADLSITEKLAYNTILLHKSAIATFCAGNKATSLSSDFLVRQAVSISRPREVKSPIWDAQNLLDWLSTPTDNFKFFEVSRRTAALLLLASGRRIHDLTRLKISKDYLVNLGDKIIL